MEKTKRTTQLSSNIHRECEHCGEGLSGAMQSNDLSDRINHYIAAHGYRLLHVGTESTHNSKGNPWHSTVAVNRRRRRATLSALAAGYRVFTRS